MLIYACQSKYLHHFIEQSRLPALARLAGGKGRLARALGEQGMHLEHQSTFAIDADDAEYLDSPRNRYVHAAQIWQSSEWVVVDGARWSAWLWVVQVECMVVVGAR